MSRRRIDVTTSIVEGREVVLVDPADYELLISQRRQVGADRAHAQRLRMQLTNSEQQIDTVRAEVARVVDEAGGEVCACDDDETCARCRMLDFAERVGVAVALSSRSSSER